MRLQRRLGPCEFPPEDHIDLRPQTGQDLGIQVLTAGHRWGAVRKRLQRVRWRRSDFARVHGRILGLPTRGRAQDRDIPGCEVTPIGKVRGQRGTDFAKPKFEQPVADAAVERGFVAAP